MTDMIDKAINDDRARNSIALSQYRAETYDTKIESPKAKESKTENQSAFSRATMVENEPKPTKPRMSDTFNMKSGFNATAESEPERRPGEAPEADI